MQYTVQWLYLPTHYKSELPVKHILRSFSKGECLIKSSQTYLKPPTDRIHCEAEGSASSCFPVSWRLALNSLYDLLVIFTALSRYANYPHQMNRSGALSPKKGLRWKWSFQREWSNKDTSSGEEKELKMKSAKNRCREIMQPKNRQRWIPEKKILSSVVTQSNKTEHEVKFRWNHAKPPLSFFCTIRFWMVVGKETWKLFLNLKAVNVTDAPHVFPKM